MKNLGLSQKEIQTWSFTNAIRSLVDKRCLGGVELEASEAVAERFQVPTNGFYIPADVSTRALNATSLTAGGYAAKTDTSKSLIEFLYAQSRVVSLGATVLNDLTGTLCIPKQAGAASVGWATETANAGASSPAFGQLVLSSKRITSTTTVSRQLLAQTSGSIEAFLRRDISRAIAAELDLQAIVGAGGAAPLGILNTAGVGSVTFGGAATWAKVVDFEAAVSNANVDGAAFLTTPDVRKKFRTVQKQSASGQYLWPDGSALMGYNAATSTNVTGDKLLFGNWSDLIIADWGQLEVLVDFYTLSLTGEIRLVAHQFMDVGLRHPESFCISTDSAAQ